MAKFWERAYQSAYERCFLGPVPRDYGVLAVWIGRFTQMAFFAVTITYPLPGVAIRFSAHFQGSALRLLAGVCAVIVLVLWFWAWSAVYRAIASYLCQVAVDWRRRRRPQTQQSQ